MTTQWGRPLTGEQMKWARLPVGTPYGWLCGLDWEDDVIKKGNREYRSRSYRLPANHIAYKVLDHNETHGTNFVPWYGGDTAPEDWDGGDALLGDGTLSGHPERFRLMAWDHAGYGPVGYEGAHDIIGYTAREEVTHPPANDKLKECVAMAKAHIVPDTVTIPRMTEAEVMALFIEHDGSVDGMLDALGLIKPGPTREERFWAETGADKSAFSPVVLDLLNKALEF